MQTTCDEKFNEAKEALAKAQKLLGEVFTERPEGFEQYKREYILEMKKRFDVLTTWIIEDSDLC